MVQILLLAPWGVGCGLYNNSECVIRSLTRCEQVTIASAEISSLLGGIKRGVDDLVIIFVNSDGGVMIRDRAVVPVGLYMYTAGAGVVRGGNSEGVQVDRVDRVRSRHDRDPFACPEGRWGTGYRVARRVAQRDRLIRRLYSTV